MSLHDTTSNSARQARRSRRAAALASLGALIALALPAGAPAARNAEVSIMDDEILLGHSPGYIDRQMRIFQRLGVDRLRVSAFWDDNSPDRLSRRKPSGFETANHLDSQYGWTSLDQVVSSAQRHGFKLMLSISTPAPLWATRGSKRNPVWRPSPREFGAYAEAVATRYGSVVDHYGISNEPNQGGWLQPQSDDGGLFSPHRYRAMVHAAYPRIKQADPSSLVLVGNLAPSGSNKRGRRAPIRPLRFLRALACVDRRYRPTRRGRCSGFRPIPTDAIGYHPYQLFTRPFRGARNRDDAGIGNGRRLLRVLDRLVRRGRIRPSGSPRVSGYYTEFGYQTFPPDPFSGISLRRHRRWLQEAAYVAWRTPRIRGLNQFRLTDGAIRGRGLRAYREFQSGLLFRGRRRKPAFRSFPHPFVIVGGRFWGQVRRGAAHTVSIQHRPSRESSYRTIRRVETNRRGYFSVRLRRRRGYWRYVYSDGPSGTSDTIRIRR
jgi:hypothetical protein